ncbi:TPA: hypothetical protein QCV71_005905 [Bacillus cereus]|nr:hypothetical protein [Bacillus cereus]HDR6771365.1 hypothetical protein [Bacillus cereus]
MARPKTTKPYRKRLVRFSYVEDALKRILERVDDPRSRMEIQKELAEMVGKQKALEKEKELVG